MTNDPPSGLRVLRAWSDVPAFDSERAEADFWLHHSLDPRLMAGSVLKNDARESATVTLRFDPRLLARLKRLARSRYLNYQSMIKQWLAERLEQEKSE
jgi:predicted DNA binding CopG/RHH family protein